MQTIHVVYEKSQIDPQFMFWFASSATFIALFFLLRMEDDVQRVARHFLKSSVTAHPDSVRVAYTWIVF